MLSAQALGALQGTVGVHLGGALQHVTRRWGECHMQQQDAPSLSSGSTYAWPRPRSKTVHEMLAYRSVSKAFSTQAPAAPVAEKTSFGGLKDDDRIFQNIYGRHDLSIKVWGAAARLLGGARPGKGCVAMPCMGLVGACLGFVSALHRARSIARMSSKCACVHSGTAGGVVACSTCR